MNHPCAQAEPAYQAAPPTPRWVGQLNLRYHQHDQAGTRLTHQHQGPMRVLKSLYPDGPRWCHTVLVHPPGGMVGGDELNIDVELSARAQVLISTPGAARIYGSDGAVALQRVSLRLAQDARLAWCPLETIAYPGCMVHSCLNASLSAGAQLLAWDVVALGLPASGLPFGHGSYHQTWSVDGLWREQARIDASDTALMRGQLGLAGHSALGMLCLISADAMSRSQQEQLLQACRATLTATGGPALLGASCPNPHVLTVRGLAHQVEPLMLALQAVWATLRGLVWGQQPAAARIWQV